MMESSSLADTRRSPDFRALLDRAKLAHIFDDVVQLDETELELLQQHLLGLELQLIQKWDLANHTMNDSFVKISSECFDIVEILPIPIAEEEKIENTLKLITYGYLGERWESARRYLIENETSLITKNDTPEGWDIRLPREIFQSIFFLVRKRSWEDLSKAIEIINKLRRDQEPLEKELFENTEPIYKKTKALELASLYHLAKGVEVVCEYQLTGKPNDPFTILDQQFENAIKYSELSRNIGYSLTIRLLQETFKKMILNSVWRIAHQINSRATKFVNSITHAERNPIIELLYPQRKAISDGGLLDPAQKAIVVNLPTSSGKTIIAEFSILQALNQLNDEKGWVVYIVPTRILVNQIFQRLKKDMEPIGISVEKASAGLDIDAYEDRILSKGNKLDILVTTPEKFSLLLRQGIENKLGGRPLGLVVMDEAHNIGDKERGINFELLLTMIKQDCERAHFLLLTPFINNADEIAKWLDPQNSKSISIELDWTPNDRVIGTIQQIDKDMKFTTLLTPRKTLNYERSISLGPAEKKIKSRIKIASKAASQIKGKNGIIIICGTIPDTYSVAKDIYNGLPENDCLSPEIKLVKQYIISELGEDFPLAKYIEKGIGMHHAKLPEDVRLIMERLMESGEINYLVSTSTIAQGVNFPVSTMIMSDYTYGRSIEMPSRDFWNLAGRIGRMDQKSVGLIGIAVRNQQDDLDTRKYLKQNIEELESSLRLMVDRAYSAGRNIDFATLFINDTKWSTFLQYLSHLRAQSANLAEFDSKVETRMRGTLAYNQMAPEMRRAFIDGVNKYSRQLEGKQDLVRLSDTTGFCVETISDALKNFKTVDLESLQWKKDSLFGNDSSNLAKLMGLMLKTPEVNSQLQGIIGSGPSISHDKLSKIIHDWVNGKDIPSISEAYFGGKDTDNIQSCVSAIYKNLTLYATWGFAAFQKIPGIGPEITSNLNEEEKRENMSLPSMIYYGVNTQEAVILRRINVPRTIAVGLGEHVRKELGDNIYQMGSSDISRYLDNLDDEKWNSAARRESPLSGAGYKSIWKSYLN